MKRLLLGSVAIGVYVLSVTIVSAQAPQAPAQGQGRAGGAQPAGRGQPPPTDLQVLPKDMTAQQVIPIMQAFAAGLGVACGYCHVTAQDAQAAGARGGRGDAAAAGGRGGAPPMNDFASDAKPTKKVARTMMLEVQIMAEKLGVRFAVNVERRMDMAGEVGAHKTSMLQDLERGRTLEIDAMLGAVVELGELTGDAMPMCRSVLALVKERARTVTA